MAPRILDLGTLGRSRKRFPERFDGNRTKPFFIFDNSGLMSGPGALGSSVKCENTWTGTLCVFGGRTEFIEKYFAASAGAAGRNLEPSIDYFARRASSNLARLYSKNGRGHLLTASSNRGFAAPGLAASSLSPSQKAAAQR